MKVDKNEFPKLQIPFNLEYNYESIRLHKFLQSMKFETIEQYQEFVNKEVVGHTPEKILKKFKVEKTNRDIANELATKAWEEEDEKADLLIKTALKLDPENVEAKLFLALDAEIREQELDLLIQTVNLAEGQLGEEYFEQYTGHFWQQPESRPFMYAKLKLVECYLKEGLIDDAIAEMEDMLELNENDNQGVRDMLAPLLVTTERFGKYKRLRSIYKNDNSATSLYTLFCFLFKTEGPSKKAIKALETAVHFNPFILDYLTGRTALPEQVPGYYTPGEESEAMCCIFNILPMFLADEQLMEFINLLKQMPDNNDNDKMRIVR